MRNDHATRALSAGGNGKVVTIGSLSFQSEEKVLRFNIARVDNGALHHGLGIAEDQLSFHHIDQFFNGYVHWLQKETVKRQSNPKSPCPLGTAFSLLAAQRFQRYF